MPNYHTLVDDIHDAIKGDDDEYHDYENEEQYCDQLDEYLQREYNTYEITEEASEEYLGNSLKLYQRMEEEIMLWYDENGLDGHKEIRGIQKIVNMWKYVIASKFIEELKENYDKPKPLEEDKKQMKEHYESVVMTDKELIDEFYKRFIVPQFYTREHIIERVEDHGCVPTDDKVDELIKNFKDVYSAVDEILDEYIDAVDFERKEE